MRILDAKGRLFGLVNLLDLMIVSAVLLMIVAAAVNIVSSPRATKTQADVVVKILYRVPNEVARNQKILKPGDTVLVGNGVVEKIEDVRPTKDYDGRETGMCDIIIRVRAKCVVLNNEYFCANMPVKINSLITIANPAYVFSNGVILDVEAIG